MNNKIKFAQSLQLLAFILLTCWGCNHGNGEGQGTKKIGVQKTAVLFVNHGSRSETWRNALLDLEKRVTDSIMSTGKVQGIKTAFMEYTEPSIATRLKEFDKEGYSDVIIVPVFLTVSTHSFDDIPTIVGQKEDPQSMETLKIEKIERYKPNANVHIAPLLDFTDVLQKNILRRAAALTKNAKEEGLVLIAYGDHTYNTEWTALLNKVGAFVQQNTGIKSYSYGWCGHVANYNPDSTTVAIKRALKDTKSAIVVPVLVAHDEMFQVKIIGDGIAKINGSKEKVTYVADAILPDKNVENWVIGIATEYAEKITKAVVTK
ncbi:MAG: cobalamin biosynthesis protein CbiX [Chitinophagaceae bacterium]|nr:cobalamin biosynthesis protein CbiX [Chitinophagaceae bacterium]